VIASRDAMRDVEREYSAFASTQCTACDRESGYGFDDLLREKRGDVEDERIRYSESHRSFGKID
jgi:hypothetical protein